MVRETRSRSKMGADGDSSKNQVADKEETSLCSRKAECLGLRRLARETSSKDTRTSPSPTRKSERIQKKSSPVPPVVCDKLDKLDTPSPLRRSVRGKRNVPSSPKIPEDESVSSGMESHGKKEETMKQRMMESENVSTSRKVHYKSLSSIGKKRKRINGHSYALLLKRRQRRGTLSGITKSKRLLQLPEVDSSDSGNEESTLAEDEENGDNKCQTKITNELTNHIAPHIDDGASKEVLEACHGIETSKIPNLVCSGFASGEDEIIRSSKTQMSNTELEVTVADANMHTCISTSASEPLSGHEKHFFTGFCVSCSKQRRVGHDSPKVELCSCVTIHNKDNNYIPSPEDGVGKKAILISGSAEKCVSRKSEGDISDPYADKNENVCIACKEVGKSLLCNGNGCKRCYHLPPSGPSIKDVPLGIWHCLWCQMKKIAFGVHSVTKGVDSICDAREVDISGTHMQKQYLVKYIDLAHVHNHWVSEAQLLFEAPFLVAKYSDNNQVIRWNSEWTLPHRLLKKRLLSFSKSLGDCQNFDSGHKSECQYEWLVKWRGLDYENATWELEIADCLRSPHGQTLIREYELRLERAKQLTGKNNKQSLIGLPKIWDGSSLISDMDMLDSMNKLHDHWSKSENVALYDDQEQMMKIGLFILSMSMVCCWPVLIVTASNAISHWEAELKKWAPTVDCVVYHGSRETRRIIEMCEFYSQGGSIILQVLLISLETAVEDIYTLNRLNWELVVFDQCQHLNLSAHVEKVETLGGLKVLLFNGPIKHSASESSNILSLVYPDGDLEKADLLKTSSNDTLGQWKERVASQEFFEYWLPVQLSELQLELYCDTLLSNIDALCSYSKSDPVGALNDMLLNVRKCCDHPYIIFDPSTNLPNKELSQANILDIGIQASGKLQLLDKMLFEMKCRQLRTIILFQSYVGTTPSIGNILEDFLSQRFGEKSYELVDSFLVRSKKDSALIRFNSVENGRFVFLLENRACKPSIKLSSVDNVIIYSSDTNPSNDLKLLEKISFHSTTKEIKVFRLYSCFTVEEQALVIANKETDHSHSLNRNLNDTLRWGAADLFCRLDEYNANESHLSSRQLLLSVALEEFCAVISETPEKDGISSSLIAKVPRSSSHLSTNLSLFGKQKVNGTGEEPCVFWKSLLGVRSPQWRYISCRSPRSRKRGHCFGKLDQTPEIAGNVVKKYKRMSGERGQISASEEGYSAISSYNVSLPASTNGNNGLTVMHSYGSLCAITREEPAEIMTLSDKQSSVHILLKAEMEKVFEVLKLPDDVKRMAAQFLEYVIENHRISRERVMPVNIFQAFQISMCWMAGKLLKQKIDKDEMLELTKEHLKFKCTKEEATAVYQRFRALKKLFLQNMKGNEQSGNVSEHCEADKKGDTCKNLVQPPLEEHITDEILIVEQPKEFRVGYDHPAEVQENVLNVVVGFEHDVEANTVNKYEMTNIGGDQKDIASNCNDVNQTSDKVASSDDGPPQNQCSRAHSSKNQGTPHIEAGLAGSFVAIRHEISNSEAAVPENFEPQHATNAYGRSIHGKDACVSCVQEDYDLLSSRASQSVETGTPTQAPHDDDSRSRDPLDIEFDRIRGEMAHAAMHQDDLRAQLKSDCKKEIEETIAEILNRYNAKLQESETKYSLRKSEFGGNMNKVLMSKLLADNFRTKCEEDLTPSRIVAMWQALPASFMQHLHQLSVQPTLQSAYLTGFSYRVGPATIASPSAGEQISISETTRVPSHYFPSGCQESATALSAVGYPRRPPPSSISLPPARQQNFSTVPLRTPTIASPSAGEQTSISETTRVPSHSLPSGGQESATAPSAVRFPRGPPPSSISLPPARQQHFSTVPLRTPTIASPSAGKQTSISETTRVPSHSLPSGGQESATASSAVGSPRGPPPSSISLPPARQQKFLTVQLRTPTIASPSAGEQTSISETTRVTSHFLPSGGQESATAPSAVGSPRGPPPSSVSLPPTRQQNFSTVQFQTPTIASPSAAEQTSISETTRVPFHSLPSGGQESATAPSAVGSPRGPPPSSTSLPPARQQNFSTVQLQTPTIASPSAGEQTPISETTRVSSHSLRSGGQESGTAPSAVGSPRGPPPSSVSLPPARQQNFSTVQSGTPTIGSPSAGEQPSISEIMRVPSNSLPSGGQESATAPSAIESPRRPPPPSTVQSWSPSIASSSAGEQTPASATIKPPFFSLCSAEQQLATSQPAMFSSAAVEESSRRPSLFWFPPARQRNYSMVWTRSPLNTSFSAGGPTSAPAITRPPSFSLSSGGQQLATSQPTLSKYATVDESPRRPTPPPISLPQASSQQSSSAVWSRSPSIAMSLGGQPVAVQQTSVSSGCSMFGKSSRASNTPPVICSITPSSGNLRRGDIRAPAPHLQSFKPSRFSLAPNFSPSDPPSLNHAPPLPSADSSQNSKPKEHSEPNNRTSLYSANISATELLRNLEDSLGRLSAVQQNECGRQGFCTAANFFSPSSSRSSPNPSPSQTTNLESTSLSQDKEQQLQPPAETDDDNHVPKAVPFSELLRNLDNQALLNQSTYGLPSLPKTNLGTEGGSIKEGSSASSSAPLSIDVVCLSDNEE